MSSFVISGGIPLRGKVSISGAKNASMPIIVASMLASEDIILNNVPFISDIVTLLTILRTLGVQISVIQNLEKGKTIKISPSKIESEIKNGKLSSQIRTTTLALGPLLLKNGYAKITLPGGCKIGARKIDLHCKALTAMGAEILETDEYLEARASQLEGIDFTFPMVSVGATEHIITTATMAKGVTNLYNIATEPEVIDLIEFLNFCGAKIVRTGDRSVRICGVEQLNGGEYFIIPDRIEVATYAVMAAITDGEIEISGVDVDLLDNVKDIFLKAGISMVSTGEKSIICKRVKSNFNDIEDISTEVHPGFPTDIQPVFVALLALDESVNITIKETIFENRFRYSAELNKLGCDIAMNEDGSITVKGVEKTKSGAVSSLVGTDLRACAALTAVALARDDITVISDIEYIDRGYYAIQRNLINCGARIKRISKVED